MFRTIKDWVSCGPCKRRMEKLENADDVVAVKVEEKKHRERRYPAVLTGGMGSTACTMFTNGAMASAGGGKVTYRAPDGSKTVVEGSGYSSQKNYHSDDESYDVSITVYPSGRVIP